MKDIAQAVAVLSALAILVTGLLWIGDIKGKVDLLTEIQLIKRVNHIEAELRVLREYMGLEREKRDHFGD